MIVQPRDRSTSAPSTFMATSQIPDPAPSANRPTATIATLLSAPPPSPATTRPAQAMIAPDRTVRAGPSRRHDRSGRWQCNDRSDRRREQDKTELGRGEPQLVPDRRDPADQRRESNAIDRKGRCDRVARPQKRNRSGALVCPRGRHRARSDDGAGLGEHLLAVDDGGQLDPDQPIGADLRDGARHRQSDAVVVVRDDDRAGEPHAVLHECAGITSPFGQQPPGQRHREHAVRDHSRQARGSGHPVAPVDRIDITGGTCVADQIRPCNPILPLGQRVADVSHRHHPRGG